jgi:Asp-tRNA(Asn)/Glu-tRNA(Gln) amidotransferase A subunit family amidase
MGAAATGAPAQALDLASTSIAQLLSAQSAGQVTCVQIAQAAQQAVEQLNSRLTVFISLNPNLMQDAARLDAQRAAGTMLPLQCVPLAVKDNIDVQGLHTTGGSVLLKDNLPARDATVVQRLRAAGALVIGKTNLDELAVAGSTISSIAGQTLNPYDPSRFAAGSSGGSSVAVSTGMAMCALGTETVNSLRNAASSAGVVAVRTTHGVLSRAGSIPLSSTMDVVGPICKSVNDAARMLAVMNGAVAAGPHDATAQGLKSPYGVEGLDTAGMQGKRLGVLTNLFGRDAEHEGVNTVLHDALRKLQAAGAEIVQIDDAEFDSDTSSRRLNVSNYEFPALFNTWLAGITPVEGVANVRDYYDAHKFPVSTMGGFMDNAVKWKNPLDMPEYRAQLEYRDAMRRKVLGLMDDLKLDALVYPSQKRPPLKLDDKPRPERNGVFASALGFPAVDLPAGFTVATAQAPQGLPVGMDLMGRPYDDMALLRTASAVERVLQGRREPGVAVVR